LYRGLNRNNFAYSNLRWAGFKTLAQIRSGNPKRIKRIDKNDRKYNKLSVNSCECLVEFTNEVPKAVVKHSALNSIEYQQNLSAVINKISTDKKILEVDDNENSKNSIMNVSKTKSNNDKKLNLLIKNQLVDGNLAFLPYKREQKNLPQTFRFPASIPAYPKQQKKRLPKKFQKLMKLDVTKNLEDSIRSVEEVLNVLSEKYKSAGKFTKPDEELILHLNIISQNHFKKVESEPDEITVSLSAGKKSEVIPKAVKENMLYCDDKRCNMKIKSKSEMEVIKSIKFLKENPKTVFMLFHSRNENESLLSHKGDLNVNLKSLEVKEIKDVKEDKPEVISNLIEAEPSVEEEEEVVPVISVSPTLEAKNLCWSECRGRFTFSGKKINIFPVFEKKF